MGRETNVRNREILRRIASATTLDALKVLGCVVTDRMGVQSAFVDRALAIQAAA